MGPAVRTAGCRFREASSFMGICTSIVEPPGISTRVDPPYSAISPVGILPAPTTSAMVIPESGTVVFAPKDRETGLSPTLISPDIVFALIVSCARLGSRPLIAVQTGVTRYGCKLESGECVFNPMSRVFGRITGTGEGLPDRSNRLPDRAREVGTDVCKTIQIDDYRRMIGTNPGRLKRTKKNPPNRMKPLLRLGVLPRISFAPFGLFFLSLEDSRRQNLIPSYHTFQFQWPTL